jgi:Icc-related predicted phosphoesterase
MNAVQAAVRGGRMKILAFSDLHGDEAALESLARIAPSYDYVFACGDLSRSVSFAEDVLRLLPKSLIVPGNWDNKDVDDALSASPCWVHGKRVELGNGLNAVGFGYSAPTPFFTYGELGEDEIYAQMSKLPIGRKTLLLLHSPPKGHLDEVHLGRHIGSESVLRIIEERKPLAAFFGHAHEAEGFEQLGKTALVKLPPASSMRACSVMADSKKILAEYISL